MTRRAICVRVKKTRIALKAAKVQIKDKTTKRNGQSLTTNVFNKQRGSVRFVLLQVLLYQKAVVIITDKILDSQ